MRIERLLLYIVMSIVLLDINISPAGDKLSLSIGVGYGAYKMGDFYNSSISSSYGNTPNEVSKQLAVGNGFNFNAEILYDLRYNLSVGSGISYLYGSKRWNLEFDAERYGLTGEAEGQFGNDCRGSDIKFYFPYIVLKQNLKNAYLISFVKMGLGFGFGNFDVSAFDNYSFPTSGPGFLATIGSSFSVNSGTSADFEIGYRIIRTKKLSCKNDLNLYYQLYFADLPLDFSGIFIQSSFSFRL